jgi:hypothetical protein
MQAEHELKIQHHRTHGQSNIRCKATYQGDRCILPRGHEIPHKDLGILSQPMHAGQFNVWNHDTGELAGVSVGSRMGHHRSRRLNKLSRFLTTSPDIPRGVTRAQIIADLKNLEKFYGGTNAIPGRAQ